jgi:hypothetical protein
MRLLFLILLLASPASAQTREHIRDAQGRNIGYLIERQHRVEAYASTGQRLGYYDRRQDKTYDRSGRMIARGNITSALIWKGRQ